MEHKEGLNSRTRLYNLLVQKYVSMQIIPVDGETVHIPASMTALAMHKLQQSDKDAIHRLMMGDAMTCIAMDTRFKAVSRSETLQMMLRGILLKHPARTGEYRYCYDKILGLVYPPGVGTDWFRSCKVVGGRICKRVVDGFFVFRLSVIVEQICSLQAPADDPDECTRIRELQQGIRQLADVLTHLMVGTVESSMYQCRDTPHNFDNVHMLSREQVVKLLALFHSSQAASFTISNTR
jgi:hypothetical protein